MHGVLAVGEELGQSPEGVFFVQVHEQNSGDLTHPLAVAHLLGEGGGPGVKAGWSQENEWGKPMEIFIIQQILSAHAHVQKRARTARST